VNRIVQRFAKPPAWELLVALCEAAANVKLTATTDALAYEARNFDPTTGLQGNLTRHFMARNHRLGKNASPHRQTNEATKQLQWPSPRVCHLRAAEYLRPVLA
jgi:hypothetical protein